MIKTNDQLYNTTEERTISASIFHDVK